MSSKTVSRIAWTLCVIVGIAAAINVILSLAASDTVFTILDSATTFIIFVVFAVVGALIISHQPRNMVGWLLMIEATLVFLLPLDSYFSNLTQAPTHLSLLTMIGLWIYSWGWLWYIFPILFIPLFFPTGELHSSRWRWLVALGLGLCFFFILFVTFSKELGGITVPWSVPNPIGFLPKAAFPDGLWTFLLLSFVALSAVSLFVRFRHAERMERDQIKWLLVASALFSVVYAVSFVTSEIGGFIDDLLVFIRSLSIALLPIAIAFAILRYRLYDIDLIIRKTVQYGVVTAVLALIYFGTIILLQSLVGQATGEQSPIVIVLSTLLIAAMFNPLRRRVQTAVDRRFYRQKYDAQQVLAQFAITARDETDIETLQVELLRVVQDTLQPESVSVWIKPEKGKRSQG